MKPPPFVLKMHEYVVKELSYPVDTVKAKNIASEFKINIRFVGKDINWSTSDSMPTYEQIIKKENNQNISPDERSVLLPSRQGLFYVNRSEQGIYILSAIEFRENPQTGNKIILPVIFVILIFSLLYLVLRWMFNPLKKLSDSVKQISLGQYNAKLPFPANDEIGDLSKAINEMVTKILYSIQSKEQLLINVSHEIRTPLTRIKMGLEMNRPKESINEDANEIEKLVDSLLKSYKYDNGGNGSGLKETEICGFLKEVIQEYEESTGRIKISVPPSSVIIIINQEQIKSAFRNVIDNALKYSDKNIEISLNEDKDNIIISFKDYGKGIPAEKLKYIYEPFFRVDESRSRKTGGVGLGLTIVKKIIDEHNGRLVINSRENQGTEVIIKLKK